MVCRIRVSRHVRALSAVKIDHQNFSEKLEPMSDYQQNLPTIIDAPKTEHDPPSTTLGHNCRRHFKFLIASIHFF
jgi:hypothetical protein